MTEAGFKLKDDLPSKLRNQRSRLYDWLCRCLMGPDSNANLESEDFDLRRVKPLDRYHVGILFPIVKGITGTDPASKETEEAEDDIPTVGNSETDEKALAKPATIKRRYVPPSSAGFSFFIRGNDIKIQIAPWAVRYELKSGRDSGTGQFLPDLWHRKPFSDQGIYLSDFQP